MSELTLEREMEPEVKNDLFPGQLEMSEYFNDATYLVKDPLGLISLGVEKFGSFFYLRSIGSYVVADADILEKMLILDENYFSKSPETMAKISPAIGSGLSTLIGDEWKRHRKLANPAFTKKSVSRFFEIFHQCIDDFFTEITNDGSSVIDITQEMKKLTLRIVISCLFSTDIKKFSDDVTDALEILQEQSIKQLWSPESITAEDLDKFEHAKSEIDSIIYGIISDRRRASVEKTDDLLGMYMEARYEDTGEGLTDIQLRHEIMNLFLAGHETTANGVAFALYLLASNENIQDAMYSEQVSILGNSFADSESIKSLDLTGRVFKESLRLYPSSWGMSRVALKDYHYKNYVFPSGADIIVAQWGLHRNPEYWTNPLDFDPDRFLPERIKEVHKFAYIPFGAGARKCIGVHLAEAEGVIILSRFIKNFSISLTSETRVELKARLFMTSEPGIKLNIQKRP